MEEIVKKTKAPAKPRKTAAKKTSTLSNVTEITVSANGSSGKQLSHEQVALLAHRYWAERGHQHGHHVEDWFRAEQELRGMAS
jgi:DUF2934 family protein